MKPKFGMTMLAILLALSLALTGCNGDPGSGSETGTNLIGGKITSDNITGKAIDFSVNPASGRSARSAISTEELYPVKGQLQIGDMILDVEGFYDPESESFTFSGAAENYAFEFFGLAKDRKGAGKIKLKDAETGEWKEELVMFDFDPDFFINGTSARSATGLPEKWLGAWDCWDYFNEDSDFVDFRGNAQLAEQWRTMQEGYMVLTPHSIAFWFDIDEILDRENLTVADREYWRTEWLKLMSDYSVLEVEDNGDGSYDVLTMSQMSEYEAAWYLDKDEDVPPVYRKLQFRDGTGEDYEGELWIILCSFGDGDWDTFTTEIEEARAAYSFYGDRYDWEHGGDNKTLFVAKTIKPKGNPPGWKDPDDDDDDDGDVTEEGNPIQDGLVYFYHMYDNAYEVTGTAPDFTGGAVTIASTVNGKPVTQIGGTAFKDKTSITSVTIPASVTAILCTDSHGKDGAFSGCVNLETVTFEEGSKLETIGYNAFKNCTALKSIDLPEGVKIIGTAPSNMSTANGLNFGVFSGSGLTSITIPASVTALNRDTFRSCTDLATVTFAAGSQLETIGESVFDGMSIITDDYDIVYYNCESLTEIRIPSGVTSIGGSAFSSCRALETLICDAVNPPKLGNYVFQYYESGWKTIPLKAIKVPAGSVEAYKAATGWSSFTSIIEAQ